MISPFEMSLQTGVFDVPKRYIGHISTYFGKIRSAWFCANWLKSNGSCLYESLGFLACPSGLLHDVSRRTLPINWKLSRLVRSHLSLLSSAKFESDSLIGFKSTLSSKNKFESSSGRWNPGRQCQHEIFKLNLFRLDRTGFMPSTGEGSREARSKRSWSNPCDSNSELPTAMKVKRSARILIVDMIGGSISWKRWSWKKAKRRNRVSYIAKAGLWNNRKYTHDR